MVRLMEIDGKRLIWELKQLQKFTDSPGEGVTRFSYGENDEKARTWLFKQATDFGCEIKQDALKNVRIEMPQNKKGQKRIIIGSHIDTVRHGGWLDGIYGVIGGLETLRSLKDTALDKNLELVIFAEEEGSNFGSTMTGSKFIAGYYGQAELDRLKNERELTLRQVLNDPDPREIEQIKWDFSDVEAMLELHIEQGPVLEREGLSMGIVDTIFGMQVIETELEGVGNHAGATPMIERRDALCAAAECILEAEKIGRQQEDTVITVGKIQSTPDCSNVIPQTVRFSLEVRNRRQSEISAGMEQVKEEIRRISRQRGINCVIRNVSASEPLGLDRRLILGMEELAREKRIPYKVMDSGAVHDACMIAGHAPTGMIFVPSIGGRSHVPEENTKEEDLIQGAQFLLDFVQKLAKTNADL